MITHLQRTEHEGKIHLSHFHQYVSAWEPSEERQKDLSDALERALVKAKKKTRTQIVDLDGECCFHVTPMGYIILMLPWRMYRVAEEKTE